MSDYFWKYKMLLKLLKCDEIQIQAEKRPLLNLKFLNRFYANCRNNIYILIKYNQSRNIIIKQKHKEMSKPVNIIFVILMF